MKYTSQIIEVLIKFFKSSRIWFAELLESIVNNTKKTIQKKKNYDQGTWPLAY